ncbi:MAG: type II toxin-antitoxin system HicB family antitoxin [Cyanobacteriota bacterium]|nr:type II toxin-antitoxin system HicB family antitoxin [Cyanobacteriota bacterium]
MDFYTAVLKKSAGYWVALCLENGIVGQGSTQEDAQRKLTEAIASFLEACETETNIYSAPLSIEELHEFLTIEERESRAEVYELRKVYA